MREVVSVLFLIAGCQGVAEPTAPSDDAAALPLTLAGPPPTVTVGAALPGHPLAVEVTGATPGLTFGFRISAQVVPGGCPARLLGSCVDVGVPGANVTGRVDARGHGLIGVTVPDTVPEGTPVYVQIAARTAGGKPLGTLPVVERVAGCVDAACASDTGVPDLCPPGMASVDGLVCVDRWEARLEAWNGSAWVVSSPYAKVAGRRVRAAVPAAGLVPQGYVSADEAAAACAESGKRLCTSDEWLAACRGPDTWTWPYGDVHQDGVCNDDYGGTHPVVDYFGTATGVWDAAHLNDPGINQQPGTVSTTGSHPACASAWGIEDLHGNLNEWVDDAAGTSRGGSYADASIQGAGCGYLTTAHDTAYHDYSTGFRCCADAL